MQSNTPVAVNHGAENFLGDFPYCQLIADQPSAQPSCRDHFCRGHHITPSTINQVEHPEQPRISKGFITLSSPPTRLQSLLSGIRWVINLLIHLVPRIVSEPKLDAVKKNSAGYSQNDVIDEVNKAITSTEARLERYYANSRLGSTLESRATYIKRHQRLSIRKEALEALKTSFQTTNEWQRFGGFSGWGDPAHEKVWAPQNSKYGQFHGWLQLDETQEGEKPSLRYREVSLDGAITQEPLLKERQVQKSVINQMMDFFKGTDGWDELGSAVGQTLPGIGQHIATFSILSSLSPFVWLGVKGMASELDEAKKRLGSIFESKMHSQEKLAELFSLFVELIRTEDEKQLLGDKQTNPSHSKQQAEKREKGLIKLDELIDALKVKKGRSFEKSALQIAKHLQIEADKRSTEIAKQATPWGLAAMTGMFGGVCSGIFTSGLDIAATALGTAPAVKALESLAGIFEIVTAGIFIPSQLAMIVYAQKKVEEGKSLNSGLNTNKENIEKAFHSDHSVNQIDPMIEAAAKDNLEQLKAYNRRAKIYYGRGFQACEGGMVVGGALGLAGQLGPSLGVMIPSAVGTLLFAGYRIQQQFTQDRYIGENNAHIHDGDVGKAWKNIIFGENKKDNNETHGDHDHHHHDHHHHDDDNVAGGCNHHTYKDLSNLETTPLTKIETDHHNTTARLAESKALSLLWSNIRAGRSQKSTLTHQLKRGHKSFFQRTTLQADVIKTMRERGASILTLGARIEQHESKVDQLAELARIIHGLDSTISEWALRKKLIRSIAKQPALYAVGEALKKASRNKYTLSQLDGARQQDPKALKLFYDIYLQHKIRDTKAASKRMRQENFKSLYAHAAAIAQRPDHLWRGASS